MLSIPACFGLIIASEEITNALFGYGSFNEEDVKMTAQALKYFGYGVPGFALIKVLSNFFFARNDTQIPFYISVISVTANILISIYYFQTIGFIIIPIATSISAWMGVIIYLIMLLKFKYFYIRLSLIFNFIKTTISASIMGIILYLGIILFEDKLIYTNFYKSFYLIIMIFSATMTFLIISYLLGILRIKNFKIK